MKVTYIHHSSFCVELDNVTMIFDYTEGPWPELNPDRPVLLFASHRHGDHFSTVIFEKARMYSDVHIILSDDIWKKRVPEDMLERTVFVKPGTDQLLGGLANVRIETFRSTDEGVAFLVTADGLSIYHAGDLNNWRWEGEPDPWNQNMEKKYHDEISRMAGRHMNLAFLPLDPRQEQWFYLGMDEFLKEIQVDWIVPMHFWGDYTVIEKMKQNPCSEIYRDKIVDIHEDGEEILSISSKI